MSSTTDAYQVVLAGQHAAVYAYGVVGARLRGTRSAAAAQASFELHRSRRDAITTLLTAAEVTPVAAAAAYDLGGPVLTSSAAEALAAEVELGLCGPYADLVATTTGKERATAAQWCAGAALAAVSWGGEPVAFPGLPERA